MMARYKISACAEMTTKTVIPGLTRDLAMMARYKIPACAGMKSGALADYEYRAVGVAHHFGSG